MLSLIPLLIHDPDLPAQVRLALREAESTPSPLVRAKARQAAADGLRQAYGLACADVLDLMAPYAEDLRCAA